MCSRLVAGVSWVEMADVALWLRLCGRSKLNCLFKKNEYVCTCGKIPGGCPNNLDNDVVPDSMHSNV